MSWADVVTRLRHLAPWTAVALLVVVGADLVTKATLGAGPPAHRVTWIVGTVLGVDPLHHVTGWSIVATLQLLAAVAFALALVAAGARLPSPAQRRVVALLGGAVVGGVAGNAVDRLADGYVVDWLMLRPLPHWNAVVNLADVAIVLGAVVAGALVLRGLFSHGELVREL